MYRDIKISWDKAVQDFTSVLPCIKSNEVEDNTMLYSFSEVHETIEKDSMLYQTLEEYFMYHCKPILVIKSED